MNRVEPNRNVYVGHRYVPILVGEWDKSIQYEGLSIVTFEGGSYTSKKMTPAGIDIGNEEYWVVTGNYNAQVEYYRQETKRVSDDLAQSKIDINQRIDDTEEYVDTNVEDLTIYVNDEVRKNREYVDGEVLELTGYVNDEVQKTKEYVDDETALARQYVDDEVIKKVDGTIETLDLYVSNDGDDNNSGSMNSPFKTLKRTVEEIPDVIRKDHVVTIHLTEGNWSETLEINNKTIQGQLVVTGTTENRENHKVFKVFCESLNGRFLITNITTTVKSGAGQSFLFRRCPSVYVDYVKAESNPDVEKDVTGVIGLLADYSSNVRVRYSDFSGKRYGIRSNYLSKVFSVNNTGSDNTFGVGSRWGGIMSLFGTHPTGDTNTSVDSAGQMVYETGQHHGLPDELYLVNAVRGRHDGRFYKKEYFIDRINNRNTEVPQGSQIRIVFDGNQYGPHYLKVKYGGQSSTSGTTQYSEKIFTFMLQENEFTDIQSTQIHNHLLNDERIEVNHIGNRQFEVIVNPLVGLSGRWAIDMELNTFRNYEAPTLLTAEVVET